MGVAVCVGCEKWCKRWCRGSRLEGRRGLKVFGGIFSQDCLQEGFALVSSSIFRI
jgi:hypothetical protein